MKYQTKVNGNTFEIEILDDGRLMVNGEERHIDFLSLDDKTLYSLMVDNQSFDGMVQDDDGEYNVLLWGALYNVTVMDERQLRLAKSSAGFVPDDREIIIQSPMPGLIITVPVEEGQEVEAGQTLIILESMKMENELKSPRAGVVRQVSVKAGDNVEQGKTLVTVA